MNESSDEEEVKDERVPQFQNMADAGQGQTRKVYANDLKSVIKSKYDLYNILGLEGQFHLPPFDDCTMEFLRDALRGAKRLIPLSQLRTVCVPRYREFNTVNLY